MARNFAGNFVSAERLTTVQYLEKRNAPIERRATFSKGTITSRFQSCRRSRESTLIPLAAFSSYPEMQDLSLCLVAPFPLHADQVHTEHSNIGRSA